MTEVLSEFPMVFINKGLFQELQIYKVSHIRKPYISMVRCIEYKIKIKNVSSKITKGALKQQGTLEIPKTNQGCPKSMFSHYEVL